MKTQTDIRLISSEKSWIEGEAIRQLEHAAGLQGMKICVGLPDLHPGKATPVGAAFLSRGWLYPTIIGGDIGCGVGLWQTALKSDKMKRSKLLKKLKIKAPGRELRNMWMERSGVENTPFDDSLGSIGSGNHFAELQKVEQVFCESLFEQIGLVRNRLFILIHSGSRGLGVSIHERHCARFKAKGLRAGSVEAENYLKEHDMAIRWASCNRHLISWQIGNCLNTQSDYVLDHPHNYISSVVLGKEMGFLHRKGAVASDRGVVMIPGSRGSLSYLVEPLGDQSHNLQSLAHGAGRKWNRLSCRDRLKHHFTASSLRNTDLGSTVVCDDNDLLYEEAPQAYKNIEQVIEDMKKRSLLRVIATFRPIITYKVRRLP